jgi:hypothetical protein
MAACSKARTEDHSPLACLGTGSHPLRRTETHTRPARTLWRRRRRAWGAVADTTRCNAAVRCGVSFRTSSFSSPDFSPARVIMIRIDHRSAFQNQNQIYSLEQYTVIPTATYSFVPPGCRRGRLAAAFPRPHVSGRLAPASAWAVWPWSLPPVCSLPRVCYLPIAILSRYTLF